MSTDFFRVNHALSVLAIVLAAAAVFVDYPWSFVLSGLGIGLALIAIGREVHAGRVLRRRLVVMFEPLFEDGNAR